MAAFRLVQLAPPSASFNPLSRSKLHKILRQGELRPHKIRYYVENRDADFEIKMANVLHVYKEVEIVNVLELRRCLRPIDHCRQSARP